MQKESQKKRAVFVTPANAHDSIFKNEAKPELHITALCRNFGKLQSVQINSAQLHNVPDFCLINF